MKRIGLLNFFLILLIFLLVSAGLISAAGTQVELSGSTSTSVSNPDWAPTLTLPKDTTIRLCAAADSICYTVSAIDPDASDRLTLSLVSGPISFATRTFGYTFSQNICFKPASSGTYRFIWKVTDLQSHKVVDTVTYYVTINKPPQINDQLFAGKLCGSDTTRVVYVTASDPDGDRLRYVLLSGNGTINDSTGELTYYTTTAGTKSFVVAVYDACAGDTANIQDSVEISLPPYLVSADTVLHVCDTGAITFNVLAHDPEGGPVDILQVEGPGEFVMVSGTSGRTTFTPNKVDSAKYTFVYCLSDDCLAGKKSSARVPICILDTINVTVFLNKPPVLTCPAEKIFSGCVTGPFCWTVDATDPENGQLKLNLLSGNATVEGNQVCVNPQAPGSFDVVIEAVDNCGAADTCTTHVTVQPNHAPVVTSANDFALSLCKPEQVCFSALVDDIDHNLAHVIPSFGAYDRQSNRVCFMADTSGTYRIIITATDSCGLIGVDTTNVTVTLNTPPVVHLGQDTAISLCQSEEICLPLLVQDVNLKSAFTSVGVIRDNKVCFTPDGSGTFTVVVTATDDCNVVVADTQMVTVTIGHPIALHCPTAIDLFTPCGDAAPTYCFNVVDSSYHDPVTLRVLSGNATVDGHQICMDITNSGQFSVVIEATGSCGKPDTCSIPVTIRQKRPYTLTLAPDFSANICRPETICFDALVDDPDHDLISISPSYGAYDSVTHKICFNADTTGLYTIVLTAHGLCTLAAEAQTRVFVTVNQPPKVHLGPDTLVTQCEPAQVCLPATVTDLNLKSVVSNIGTYDPETHRVCFTPDGSGTFTIIVTATDDCNVVVADTQVVTVHIGSPAVLACKSEYDFFACAADSAATFCFSPLDTTVTGPVTLNVLSGNATVNGRSICVSAGQSADLTVRIEAIGACGKPDTCTTLVRVRINQPPRVQTAADFSMFLCRPEPVCFSAYVDDPDANVTGIHTNFGTYDKPSNRICFDADTAGIYRIILTATDTCGAVAKDTTVVTVGMKKPPVVSFGNDTSFTFCEPSQVCLPVAITDQNLKSVSPNFGTYDPETRRICFIPDTNGRYTLIVIAEDSCGFKAADTAIVNVRTGHKPVVKVADSSIYLCYPRELCLPVAISDQDGDIKSVTVNRGKYSNGTVCFVPYSAGSYPVVLTVTDSCGNVVVDTGMVTVRTDQNVQLICPRDTSIFQCAPDTLCFPVGGVPDGATVKVYGTNVRWNAQTKSVCFYSDCCLKNDIKVEVTTACGNKFTCAFTVSVQTNSAPIVAVPRDTSIFACAPGGKICMPIAVNDIDRNVMSITSSFGAYDAYRQILCFNTDTAGVYTAIITAKDSCGLTASATTNIRVKFNTPPTVHVLDPDMIPIVCGSETIDFCARVDNYDIDNNITSITVVGGKYEQGALCLSISDSGLYSAIITVTDACGATDVDTLRVHAERRDSVKIICSDSPDPENFCKKDSIWAPVYVQGNPIQIITNIGEYRNGRIYLPKDTSKAINSFDLRVIAVGPCNTDTCSFHFGVQWLPSTEIVCPRDTTILLCQPGTLGFPISSVGDIRTWTITPPAYMDGITLKLPVTGSGTLPITLIAHGVCSDDTCSFTVTTILNTPPVVDSKDTTLLLCKLQPVCVPIRVSDLNNNIVSITTSLGQILGGGSRTAPSGIRTVSPKKGGSTSSFAMSDETAAALSPSYTADTSVQVCFTPDQFGEYRIVITATDACAAQTIDTVVVTVNSDGSVAIVCPNVQPTTLCKPDTLCVPITITGSGFTVKTSYGTYENGHLCFAADTSGTYTIQVIGTSSCKSDTCYVQARVDIYGPVDVSCRGIDTTVFVCSLNQSVFIPVSISGPTTSVIVFPNNARIVDGKIEIPLTSSGPIPVKVVASNACSTDSCMFTLNVKVNQPPVVSVEPLQTFSLCRLEQVCFKFHVTDPDNNVTEVRASLGVVDDSILCVTPGAYGDFPVTITAIDACHDTTVATTTLRILKIDAPQIACPPGPIPVTTSLPDSVKINLAIFPKNATILVQPSGRYDTATKELVVYIAEPGTYTYNVYATTPCGTDSCQITVEARQFTPALVECRGLVDTTLCLTSSTTLCLPVTITGTAVTVVVKPVGTYANGQVCLPITQAGTTNLSIIASNIWGADTCTSKITVLDGRPPIVQLPSDTTIKLCQPTRICLPARIERTDFTITYTVTGGEYTGGENPSICVDVNHSGLYTVIVSATDSCGNHATDTVRVTVELNKPPVVTMTGQITKELCASEPVCIPITVADNNLASLTTNFGQYNAQTGQICFNPDTSGVYVISVVATDSCGAMATGTTTATVHINRAPVIAGLRDSTVYLCKPQLICLPVNITDPDGEQPTIVVNRGKYENGSICFAPYDSGSYQIIVSASDKCGATVVDTATVHVRTDLGLALQCPRDTTIFQCTPQLRCFPVGGIPEGATVRVQGTNVRWDAQTKSVCFFSDCCLENKITVYVTTQCGTYSCSFTVKVQTNSAPIVVLPRDTAYVACTFDKICLPVAINDIDKNVAAVIAIGGTYDPYRQIVCVTPTGPGTYPVIVTATDTCGLKDVDTTVITLLENHPPVVTFSPIDTLFKQCSPTEICIPVTVFDPDGNIVSIGVDGGTYKPTTGEVCLMPTGPGRYCVSIAAVDKCGARDTKSICVTVLDGDRVDIQCPNQRPTDTLCVGGPVCLSVPVTGTGYTVLASFGVWSEGQLCFNADTSGVYTIKVIAKALCHADTCAVTQAVKILEKVDIACPGNKTIFLCGPDTLCYDLTLSSSVTHVAVSAPAYITGNQVCVPILQSGLQTITVIATGKCGADTCTFTITTTFNSAPIVNAGRDTTLTECSFKQICLPFTVTDVNGNVAHVSVNAPAVMSGNNICFTPNAYGSYEFIVTATDSCGAVGKDTVKVTYNQGLSAKITCPSGVQFTSLCKSDSVYIVVPITPPTAKVTILPSGSYNPATGKVAVWVTSAGTKHIKVMAEAQCANDSCGFDLQVTFNEAPKVTCRSAIDTLMCLVTDRQLCFPLSVTGTGVTVQVKPNGTYSAGVVCIPITAAGKYDTKVIATGVCGADSCTVPITVRANQAPTLHLPVDLTIQRCPQDTQTVCIAGFSAKDVENPVTLRKVCGIGTYTAIRVDSGSICFRPTAITRYEFCFQATDGCNTTTDTFAVTFVPKPDCDVCLKVSIDGGSCTPVGLHKKIAVNVQSNEPVGGFDLLIGYDASVLSYQSASIVNSDITGWEYFTWKIGGAQCGSACPSGVVRLVGIADVNNGANHPPDSSLHPNGPIVFIDYLVKNDQSLGGQFVPVSFIWYECADNSFSDPTGAVLFMDRRIYNFEKTLVWDETDDTHYPESARPFGMGAHDSCLNLGGKTPPTRCIDFVNGGVCIISADSIDARGDVNLNGLAYEIADAVVFSNYFIRGLAAFTISVPGQIAATDINGDGLTLTVSDLALLIRIIVGDAPQTPKLNPYPDEAVVQTSLADGVIHVTTETVDNIGAAYFVYDLDPTVQVSQVIAGVDAQGMDVLSSVEGGQLRVLVYNIGRNRIEAGTRDLFEIPISGSGALKLSHVELVDYQGRPYAARIGSIGVPTDFVLNQNYPNPFNPSTVMSFGLPEASQWTLRIFNVNGALVREFSGASQAGSVEVTWDGHSQTGAQTASGIYLYRLEAGRFSDTKKMILLK